MSLYHMTENNLIPLETAPFAQNGIREREDLQRLLRGSIDTVAPDTMVLADEFSGWELSRRSIDLLCLDRQANLVVVELKRDDGGHLELQALRYAAMVAPMTLEHAVKAHAEYLAKHGRNAEGAEDRILEFLGWPEPDEETFGADVRIVLVAADFSPEIMTTVLWLSERGMDIQCVRIAPHKLGDEIVLNIEQCLPLPEVEQYQVRLSEKSESQRKARRLREDWTGYWFVNVGEGSSPHRCWHDCHTHGFLMAGGGRRWIHGMQRLEIGDYVVAYLNEAGYVGIGRVTSAAVPQNEFVTASGENLIDLPLETPPDPRVLDDPAYCDWCVGVEWFKTLDREDAINQRPLRPTVAQICDAPLVRELMDRFEIERPDEDANA